MQYTWQHHVISWDEFKALSPATGPQESVSATAPVIPATTTLCAKPEALYPDTLVSAVFNHKFTWQDSVGNVYGTQIDLPAITPFCDGAIAINESIRQAYQYRVNDAWRSYTQQYTPAFKSINYSTYLYDNILTVRITREDYTDLVIESIWMLDVSTGKQVSTADLAKQYLGESYPLFLQHRTHDLIEYYKANPWGSADDQADLLKALPNDTFAMSSSTLYLHSDGTLMLTFHVEDTDQTFTLPYTDMDIYGFEGTNEDAYHWLFHLQTDGAGADEWSTLLKKSFFCAPQEFVSMLSKEEETTVSDVASQINYALYPAEETESYRVLCEQIWLLSASMQQSETAKILLDAIKPL